MSMQSGEKLLALAALIWILILGSPTRLNAQETGKEAGKGKEGSATPAPSGGPQRRILSDGTMQIISPDGAIRRVPPVRETGAPRPEAAQAGETVTPTSSAAGEPDPMLPLSPGPELFDQSTREKYLDALRGYYAYRISGYQHRQTVFQWQFFSSKVIFVAVLALVFAGIYFAAVQFHSALGRKRKVEASESEGITEFVASVKGIKVSSPVLGVVILVISMVFFYLYLVYVYPIKPIY